MACRGSNQNGTNNRVAEGHVRLPPQPIAPIAMPHGHGQGDMHAQSSLDRGAVVRVGEVRCRRSGEAGTRCGVNTKHGTQRTHALAQ